MKLKISGFKKYGNNRIGILTPFYLSRHFKKFKLKRFFFIHGNKKALRADHAHKKCNQIFIPIKGRVNIEIINKKKIKKNFLLSQKNCKFLLVPSLHWVRIKFLDKNGIILTLCDFKYDRNEYIHNFNRL